MCPATPSPFLPPFLYMSMATEPPSRIRRKNLPTMMMMMVMMMRYVCFELLSIVRVYNNTVQCNNYITHSISHQQSHSITHIHPNSAYI